jgi:hypothetical protein
VDRVPGDAAGTSAATGATTVCPGCGLRSTERGIEPDRPINASAACWGLHAELLGFELAHPVSLGRLHQLTVDAYGAAHAGPPTGVRYVAYSLVGLCLALERGRSGEDVRAIHSRMGPPQPTWPRLDTPAPPAELTVAEVIAAGAREESIEGHERLLRAWARAVWASWAPRHQEIRALTDRVSG